MTQRFNSIESVVADLQRGKMVIVVDDADRENEGDLIMAAQFVTPAAVNFMAKHGRGLICVPTTSERLQQLGIERMVRQNRETFKTDFQVSVDAARGITTGISAGGPGGDDPDHGRARRRCRRTWCSRDTCFRCGRGPAACCSGPATPRRRWTWCTWRAAGPSG